MSHHYLSSHLPSLQEIVACAGSELDLEERFFSLEEEWSEASLVFLPYKSHGHALLEREHTLSLIEQLEHAHTLLATMLLSKHIAPLREEASQWAIKLGSVTDILQQVQYMYKRSYTILAMLQSITYVVLHVYIFRCKYL